MPHARGLLTFNLLIALAGGCALPSATIEVEHSEAAPPVFGERDTARVVEVAAEDLPAIERGVCPGEVGDYPVPYFGERVLIRLPAGVDEDNFVEMMPSFARLTGAVESSNCQPGMPGAMIEFMALALFDLDPDTPIQQFRDELLEVLGYPPEIVGVGHDPGRNPHSGMWVYEVPPTPSKPEPAKILLAIVSSDQITVAVVYEVHPDAWTVIVNTLLESASRIALVPL